VWVRHWRKDLPYLLFLQGGPGIEAGRPTETGGWISAATEKFRVILLVGPYQGLTLVHFWARRKRFLWDRGCIYGLHMGRLGCVLSHQRLRLSCKVDECQPLGRTFGACQVNPGCFRHNPGHWPRHRGELPRHHFCLPCHPCRLPCHPLLVFENPC
jgi:hypothetical protein